MYYHFYNLSLVVSSGFFHHHILVFTDANVPHDKVATHCERPILLDTVNGASIQADLDFVMCIS